MLNDTQKNLLDQYVNDYFIKTTQSFIQYAETADEKSKNIEMVKKALVSKPDFDFCALLLATYPRNVDYNEKKIALLMTLCGVVNGRMEKFKYTKSILDPRLSTKPDSLTTLEWETKQKQLIGLHVQEKMHLWLAGLEEKPSSKGTTARKEERAPGPPSYQT